MFKFILKRLAILIPVLLCVSFLVFGILALLPVNVASIQLGMAATPEGIAKWNEEHGLNRPFFERYFIYMKNLFMGNLGKSYSSNMSISTELRQRIPSTLVLAAGALFLTTVMSIPIGILSAVKQYSLFDNTSRLLAMLFTSIPAFWLGLMLMRYFSLKLGWFPTIGGDSFRHYVLPWITVSAASSAQVIRMTRSTMLEVIRADYVQTAKAKGVRPTQIVIKHELKNALLPLITLIGIMLGQTLGGAIVTETVFALPGVGTYILVAIRKYDMPAVMAGVLFVATMIGIINLVVDVLYMYIDPRLRCQFVKGYTER